MRSANQTIILPVISGMNKQIQFFLLIMVSGITLFMSSCKKKDPSPVTPQNPLITYYSDKQNAATQTFTVNATSGNVIYGTKGTKITFDPTAFTTQSGTPVSGNVTVSLIEAHTYKDMMQLNTQTIGNFSGDKKLLVSGGQIRLTATQNGALLKPVFGKVHVEIPYTGAANPSMEVFYGEENTEGNLNWNAAEFDSIVNTSDSLNNYYNFPTEEFGWINCDYFYASTSQTEVSLTMPSGYTGDNSMAWLVFPSINSVASFEAYNSSTNAISIGHGLCPIGMNVKIVVLSIVDGQYSYSIIPTTIVDNHTETITLTTTTLTDFETEINNL
jgi:hypothetical protein